MIQDYFSDDDDCWTLEAWEPQPMSVYLIGIIAFMVGFALCFLIFVP